MRNSSSRLQTIADQTVAPIGSHGTRFNFASCGATRIGTFPEETFHSLLTLERRRAERSRKSFALMLLDIAGILGNGTAPAVRSTVNSVVLKSIRETDLVGWYQQGVVLGVIFTEISLETQIPIADVLRAKITRALDAELNAQVASNVAVTVHLYPEKGSSNGGGPATDLRLYPDLCPGRSRNRVSHIVKRLIDLVGSLFLLAVLSPLLGAIAVLIKLTSQGPVIFRQQRLGQFGVRFEFLKFRTMYQNNDPKIHKEYIERYIAGGNGTTKVEDREPAVYKITKDPRVTPIGRFLRRTSLDELPQFWNVLKGEMSLVGPRPPLPYEFEIYDIWHRRRVLEVRPGVTGLWQVSGRSRTCFDDMVRLDLRYVQRWSVWLDLKILLATPLAVLSGEGAY